MSKWNPDDHLPECGVTRYPICICDRLRACEQRVRAAIVEQLRAEFPKPTLGIQKAIRMVDGS